MSLLPKRLSGILVALSLFSLFSFCSCSRSTLSEPMVLEGMTMGTFYSVKIVRDKNVPEQEQLEAEIRELLDGVNKRMSTYIDSSELSRLNKFPAGQWFPLSGELFKVLKEAQRISRISDGAFDITVGPLVNLWGFGPEGQYDRIPPDSAIAGRQKWVGYDHLQLNEAMPAAKKDFDHLYCDLSAIAKGYAVDVVAEYLESRGVANFLVEVGGEVRALGRNSKGRQWRIGVQSPDRNLGVFKIIGVSDRAVATSGDYMNYFEKNGVRYSHTIDPRTGRPITHKLASVTVLHQSCMTADALATAINVLGQERGLALAQKLELAVFLIVKDEAGFKEKMTEQFEQVILN